MIVLQTTEDYESLPSAYETKLEDYRSSIEKNVPFYITAELQTEFLFSRTSFVVGDGQIYNTYENVPLEPASYKIYQRSVTRVVNVC